jgi:hypothetical protein
MKELKGYFEVTCKKSVRNETLWAEMDVTLSVIRKLENRV